MLSDEERMTGQVEHVMSWKKDAKEAVGYTFAGTAIIVSFPASASSVYRGNILTRTVLINNPSRCPFLTENKRGGYFPSQCLHRAFLPFFPSFLSTRILPAVSISFPTYLQDARACFYPSYRKLRSEDIDGYILCRLWHVRTRGCSFGLSLLFSSVFLFCPC